MSEEIKFITIDCETDGLDPFKDRLVLIGWRINGQGNIKFIWHDNTNMLSKDIKEFRQLLSNPNITKRGHNIKFDSLFLLANNYPICGPYDDTRIMAYCENPFQDVGLKQLVRNRLKREVTEFKELTKNV